MQGHTLITPPGEELIAGQGWHDSGVPPTYSLNGHTVQYYEGDNEEQEMVTSNRGSSEIVLRVRVYNFD